MSGILEYDEWFYQFEEEINLQLAETGADREMDFNLEEEFRTRYESYLNTKEND